MHPPGSVSLQTCFTTTPSICRIHISICCSASHIDLQTEVILTYFGLHCMLTNPVAQALLTRLEAKITARSNMTDISPLMQRLFPKTAKAGGHLERYPARVFLCAYMVQSHPGVVFNTQGELEHMLAAAGSTMLTAFEALLSQMAQPMHAIDRSLPSSSVPCCMGVAVDYT